MKRTNRIPFLLAALIPAALFLFACAVTESGSPEGSPDPGEPAFVSPSVPEATPVPEEALLPEDGLTANGYVLVTTSDRAGWLPLPSEGETSYPLVQTLPDGSLTVNLIHLTPDGVYMEDSTCENHDCVEQGVVTLENRYERILGNMIICLPNQVVLQLYDPDEVRALVGRGMTSP